MAGSASPLGYSKQSFFFKHVFQLYLGKSQNSQCTFVYRNYIHFECPRCSFQYWCSPNSCSAFELALPVGSFQLMLVKGVTMVEMEASLAV